LRCTVGTEAATGAETGKVGLVDTEAPAEMGIITGTGVTDGIGLATGTGAAATGVITGTGVTGVVDIGVAGLVIF